MYDVNKSKARIKALCAQNGISQKFVSESTGHGQYFLNDVWQGKRTMSDGDFELAANALHTTPAYLRGEIDDPEPPAAEGDWVDEIKISPAKLACAKQIARLSDAHAEVMSGLFEFNEEDIRAVARALVLFKNRGE